MADQSIEILLKIQDEMSSTLKRIEGNLEDFNNKVTKQNQVSTKTFQEQTTSLLALGNAAQSVDNIFSSYTNLQLKLENATERVTGANDRLEDSQRRLNKLAKEGKKGSEEYADAQRELERAQRQVTIAENNLARANNQVIGTYLNMGVQSIALIGSLPKLAGSIRLVTLESLAFIATPLGITLAAVGVALAVVTTMYIEQKKAIENLNKVNSELVGQVENVNFAFEQLGNTAQITRDSITEALNSTLGIIKTQSQNELDLIAKKEDAEYQMILAKKEGRMEDYSHYKAIFALSNRDLEMLKQKNDALESNLRAEANRLAPLTEIQKQKEYLEKLPYTATADYLQNTFMVIYEQTHAEMTRILTENVNQQIQKYRELEQQRLRTLSGEPSTGVGKFLDKVFMGAVSANNREKLNKGTTVHDAVITPKGEVIHTDPKDYLFATKNPGGMGGMIVNINGNIYGVNANDISIALKRELANKISI